MKDISDKQLEAIANELAGIRAALEQLVPLVAKVIEKQSGLSQDDPVFSELDAADEYHDELYEEARRLVLSAGKASTAYLQKRLGIGYARAARLIDMLEVNGVVGPATRGPLRRVRKKLSPEVVKILAEIEMQIRKKKKKEK